MNLQPHQRQFTHTYSSPAYPQPPQQQQQNFVGPKAPEPCYNCGSLQHVAQHCREARRAVPAGSLNQAPRPQRGGLKKNNSKPIVTRFAPPPNYVNGPYPQQPPFPQIGPYQPHQQPRQQPQPQPQQQWPQPSQGYGPPAQTWQQQPYAAPTAAPSQAPTYDPHQAQVPQYGYGQPAQAQPQYPQQQHQYGYIPKPNWTIPAQPPQSQQPHPHYTTASQVHPQAPYVQTQNYPQYPQQQLVQAPYTLTTPQQGFPQMQNYHGTRGPQPQPFTQQVATPNSGPAPQQSPPPKPPPCFPSAEKSANTSRSSVIVWRPAQPIEIPLAATFAETDEQRTSKQTAGSHTDPPRDGCKRKHFSKYFDAKGNRINKDLAAYEPDSEMMKDPAFASVRTGESMVAQPLEFVLPDDLEEEELEEVVVGESANEQGLVIGLKVEIGGAEEDGSSEGTEAGDEQKLNPQQGSRKHKAKTDSTTGIIDGQKAKGALSETKRSWNWQSNALIHAGHNVAPGRRDGNNGHRGQNNGGNLGKRKSRSPLDSSRPQKHRVREVPLSAPSSSIQTHHHGLSIPSITLPSHHPLPPKPVIAPPPPQNFHHGNNRPQGGAQNRPQGVGNRRNQNHKQRNHPYIRRSASPVRHMLVDNQKRERDYGQKGKGRGQQGQQQQVSGVGQ